MAEPGTGADADSPSNTIAGWREWVSLPGLGVGWIKAKCDTGARTSALHAFDIEPFQKAGETEREDWVRYSVHPWQDSDDDAVACESKVVAQREVRSSSGHVEERYVVCVDLSMVGHLITAEVSLSRRDEMGFRMLIGREALRRGFVVDPGRSYLGGRPKRSVRRQNRGL
jgi:hypothetical protein